MDCRDKTLSAQGGLKSEGQNPPSMGLKTKKKATCCGGCYCFVSAMDDYDGVFFQDVDINR